MTASSKWTSTGSNNPSSLQIIFDWYDSTGVLIREDGFIQSGGSGLDITFTRTPPSNAITFGLTVGTTTGSGAFTGSMHSRLQMFCSGSTPATPNSPCCPPDPSLDLRLNFIVQMLQVIANNQLVGVSDLVDSTTHIGLSGSGTITLVNACAAIRVTVTAGLEGHPNNPGSPNYYFSLGFITSIAAGSPLKGWRLVYASQTYPLAAYADQVGYTLPPGVVVNITELLAS